jgi:hypothetical protein
MPSINGTKVRSDLIAAAKRRQRFLDQAAEIEKTVFRPLNLDPDTLIPRKKAGSRSPYVLLTRMVKAHLLTREKRGLYKVRKNTSGEVPNGYTDMATSKLAQRVLEFAEKHKGQVKVSEVTRLINEE